MKERIRRALEYFKEAISDLCPLDLGLAGRQDLAEVKVLTIGNRGEPEGNDYPMLAENGFTVGGKRKDNRGRGAKNKAIVFGILERKGKIYTKIVENVSAETLMNEIKNKTNKGSVFTPMVGKVTQV